MEEIRRNREAGLEIEEAVDKAIDVMPQEYEIYGFLLGNRAEVKDMCITEYNEAETMEMFRAEGREEGIKEGRKEGRKEGEDRLGQLVSLLLSQGRTGDIQRASASREARLKLYEEFHIH